MLVHNVHVTMLTCKLCNIKTMFNVHEKNVYTNENNVNIHENNAKCKRQLSNIVFNIVYLFLNMNLVKYVIMLGQRKVI